MGKIISLTILCIFMAMATRISAGQNGMFAIYLPLNERTADDAQKSDIGSIMLKNEPIIAPDDILSYHLNTHQIELTPSAYERIMKVAPGTPFVICVGNERLYMGVIWSDLRSASFNGIVISKPAVKSSDNIIQLIKGYPSNKYFKGRDPRSNPKIIRALKQLHKLRN